MADDLSSFIQSRQLSVSWSSVIKLITNVGSIADATRLIAPPETLRPFLSLLNVLDSSQLPRIVRRDGRAFTQGEAAVLSKWLTEEDAQISRWVEDVAIAKMMNATPQSQYLATISTDGGKTARELGRFPSLAEAKDACKIAGRGKYTRSFELLSGWSLVNETDGNFGQGRIEAVAKKSDGTFLYFVIQAVTPRYSSPGLGAPGERNSRIIPQDVKIAVTLRDQGKCVQCGSQDELHYDHKIPWSRGGASTMNNIQLLCGRCNRRKGAREGI
jgi:hypothetical protein